jgi:hypothetical protein
MKKLLIILLSVGLAFGASAQGHGGVRYIRPRVTIIGGYAPLYPYYGFGYGFGYPFYAYPPYYASRPSKLDMQIEDIRNDYNDRISSVKHDDSLSKQDRKAKVKELKHERDAAIDNAKKNYYKTADKPKVES